MARLDGPRADPASAGSARHLVILLHGYGSNGADLIALAPLLQDAAPHAAFVAPNAPLDCIEAPGGYQWWDLTGGDVSRRLAGAETARPLVDAFIDEELARFGLAEDRLVLIGFSQGTMVALHVGLRRERQVAGLIGFSGSLADDGALGEQIRTKPPVLLVHGDADEVVPVGRLAEAEASLRPLGFDLTTHVSQNLGHSIDFGGVRQAAKFLERVLV